MKQLFDLNKKKAKRTKNESEEYMPPDDIKLKKKETKQFKNTEQYNQNKHFESEEKQTNEFFELLPQQKIF